MELDKIKNAFLYQEIYIYTLSKLIKGMWFINIFNAYFDARKNITIDGETL